MARVLIVGYGNPLRGDDGLGWHAAEALRAALPEAEILAVHQLTPELAEDASRAELVIFLDAAETGAPGEWRCREIVAVKVAGIRPAISLRTDSPW
jgi:hydrogenase maturation protease